MSKVKKLLICIFAVVLSILAFANVANAAYSVGDEVQLNYSDYIKDDDLFCVEHHQRLRSNKVTYKVISQVNIEGNVSTDHKGKSITHKSNSTLAYILSSTDNGSNKSSSPVQNAVWNYMYTWMTNVGQYHAGLYQGFANNVKGKDTTLEDEASDYANEIENIELTDNTNKNAISVKSDGNYIKIGPFNWSFSGKLNNIVVNDQNGNAVRGITFSKYAGTTANTIGVGDIQSGKDFYISIPISSGLSKITTISASGSVEVKGVTIWFLEAQTDAKYQNLIAREPYKTPYDYETEFDYNIDLLGGLKVIKVNEDNHEIRLQGVGFKIQNKQSGLYVHQDANGNITYVAENQATEFVTDANGEILIENLIVGTYVAYETQNPNYGYEIISEGVEHTVVVDKTEDFVIGNKQIYVKLSGYVWIDVQSGKQSQRNSLYRNPDYDEDGSLQDDADQLLEGVIVRLIDRRTGEVVKNDNGEDFYATTQEINLGDNIIRYYQFVDVRIDDLENYYIEFEYDGLTYTNVTPHIDKDNGSKAAENPEVRDEFNKDFSTIEGDSETTGVALDENGNVAHELRYNKNTEQHTSTLINEGLPVGQYPITANTDETDYSIIDEFEYGMEEIPYNNLGLYIREQPDLAVIKDMQNVRLAINGYQHIYEYGKRFENLAAQEADGDYSDTAFNVGVKFASEYIDNSYTRAIYRADYEYENESSTVSNDDSSSHNDLDIPCFLRKKKVTTSENYSSKIKEVKEEKLKEKVDEYYKEFISKDKKSILTYLLYGVYYLENREKDFYYNDLIEFLNNNKEEILHNELYIKLIYLCYVKLKDNTAIDKRKIFELLNEEYKKIAYTNLKFNIDLKIITKQEIEDIIAKDTIVQNINEVIWYLYNNSTHTCSWLRY